ncbi:MAG TPA: DUF1343 domain-containing protein [Candidatus Limnocylindria bacterium]|nr:DUF1343 domain-containing protein [Candidatus Limnocylindria bacterium]
MRLLRHAFSVSLAGVLGSGCATAQAPPIPSAVRPGIDVLVEDSLHLVKGRAVGLLTNRTGVDRRGVSDIERLRAAGVNLVALFTPEHGFRGAADPGAAVATTRDSVTGLPIYSLYGSNFAPTPQMLAGVQVLLVDLPDAGARYFTYVSTTIEVMKSPAMAGIPVIILDRPDPVGGAVQGNVLDSATRSFVGSVYVPMRHGLTPGELALLAKQERQLAVDLRVVPVSGWHRSEYLDATGLTFYPPSPNLRDLESIINYSGTCLFEGTNLSAGRGSDAPFSQVGAPWLDPASVLARLGPQPGVSLVATSFTPRQPGDGKYADTLVQAIRLRVTDRATYDAPATALRLLAAIRQVHPTRFAWNPAHFDRLAGQPGLREALDRGAPIDSILGVWTAQRAAFAARATGVRLYPE